MARRADRFQTKHLHEDNRIYLEGDALDGHGRWFRYIGREYDPDSNINVLVLAELDPGSMETVELTEAELNGLNEGRLKIDDLVGEFREELPEDVWPINEPARPTWQFFDEDDPTTGWSRETFRGVKSLDGETTEFDGYVKGRWGVRRAGDRWGTTHLRSGLSIGYADKMKHAKIKASVADRIFDEDSGEIADIWALAWINNERTYERMLDEYDPRD